MSSNFTDFIVSEKDRFENRHNNMFAFAFSHITIYREYLQILLDQHKISSKKFIENHQALQKTFLPGTHKLTQQQLEIQVAGRALTTQAHLEIESFYLFAKILLDKIANAIEFYFGEGRSLPLTSHDKLTKNIEKYAEIKGLTIDKKLIETINRLKTDISDFRDYQIQHIAKERNPRTMKGTLFDAEGNVRLSLNHLYPTDKDKQHDTKTLADLIDEIDEYIEVIVKFTKANSDKTVLELEKNEKAV